jgi:hypothetical protein
VAAGAHGDEEIMLPRQLDRLNDIGSAQTTGYDGGTAVDHRVPDRAGGVVAVLSRQGRKSTQLAFQGGKRFFGYRPCCVQRADDKISHMRLRLAPGPSDFRARRAANFAASMHSFHARSFAR